MGIKIAPGQKIRDFITFIDTKVKTPITVIRGAKEGSTVLIMGGIHSAEYVGIQTAIELANEIDPQEVCGDIIILPVVNTDGFAHRTISMVHEDGKNLNRVFPGKKDGTLADKMAYTLTSEIYPKINYIIDLHCGDSYEQLTPYIYAQGAADEEICKRSLEMAKQADVPYIVLSQSSSGGTYNYAGSIGIPGVLLERGKLGVWSEQEVIENKKDVRRILASLGILDIKLTPLPEKKILQEVIYQNAECAGCFYPTQKAGDIFSKGELLGEIRDYFGNTIKKYYSEFDGVMLYQTVSLTVLKDGPMIAYAKLD